MKPLLLFKFIVLTFWGLYAQEIEKKIDRIYQISNQTHLYLKNKFGQVNVNSGPDNKLSLSIHIKVKAKSQAKAEKILHSIEIEESISGNEVAFVTKINEDWNHNKVQYFSIDYEVTLPNEIPINLANKYGNIALLDNHQGNADLEVKYGNLNTQNLNSKDNNVEVKYGNLSLGYVKNLELEAKYCGHVDIESAGRIEGTVKYSKLKMGKVNYADMEIAYANSEIAHLSKYIVCEHSYGNLEIEELSPNFEEVDIDSKYGNTNIVLLRGEEYNFTFDAELSYGNLRFDNDKFIIVKDYKDGHDRTCEGKRGTGKVGFIRLRSNYGNVRIMY